MTTGIETEASTDFEAKEKKLPKVKLDDFFSVQYDLECKRWLVWINENLIFITRGFIKYDECDILHYDKDMNFLGTLWSN